MTQTNQQIVHESETQRQFIRLQMPAQVDTNGQRYSVNDLSAGGCAIRDINESLKRGDRLNLKLILPFSDFALDVALEAQVQHYDSNLKVAGCSFINLNAGQVSILSHVMKSFI